MPLVITWTFAPGQIIFSSRFNTNFSDVSTWANAHEIANTGPVHGITGNFVDTGTAAQIITVTKTHTLPKIVGAGVGLVGLQYENTANNRTHTIPAKTADDTFAMLSDLGAASPFFTNAKLSIGAGILKIVGANGLDPSTANPVTFLVPSRFGSILLGWTEVTFTSTANSLIKDSTSGDSYFDGGGGVPWGTTAGTAWAVDMPFGIYVTTDGTTPAIFMARIPKFTLSGTALQNGWKDNPPATPSYQNCFFWSANDLTVSHQDKPCWLIGTVLMQKTAAGDWTFNPVTSPRSFGDFTYFGKYDFLYPASQNGAAANSWVTIGGAGTAPTYASGTPRYSINLDGVVYYRFQMSNVAGGTAGAGAGTVQVTYPIGAPFNESSFLGNGAVLNAGTIDTLCTFENASTIIPSMFINYQTTIVTARAQITGADQNNVNRRIVGSVIYQVQ